MNRYLTAAAALALTGVMSTAAHAGSVIYVTDFAKNDNIYTNLNQAFPNTGPGVPGSGQGTANASYLWTPPATGAGSLLNDVNNGINFNLTSDASGHDFTDLGGTLNIATSVNDATTVYLLLGAYFGVNDSVTFTGSGGATQTFTNVSIPDFNGGSINVTSPTFSDQTVFQVHDVGAGGTGNSSNGDYNYYDLTEATFVLGSQFAGQTLTSTTIVSSGYETLVLGETVASSDTVGTPGGVPEPASWAMMLVGFGGLGGVLRRRRQAAVAPA
jgi:PEP-CTERM motif